MGIAAFNEACRESVLKYTEEWHEYVTRQARWVDFDNDYKTLDTTFMESVIWAFKQLYDKGLAYEGYRVLPYCWRDETPLSNHELRMDDDVYQSRQDPALTVGLRLETGELALHLDDDARGRCRATSPSPSARTSTTSSSSRAATRRSRASACAGATSRLARVRQGARRGATVVATVTGATSPAAATRRRSTTSRATRTPTRCSSATSSPPRTAPGIVHLAPAFGEDDMAVCEAAGIATVVPVDARGRFTTEVPDYAGMQVFDANKPIIADLKAGTGPLARTPRRSAPSSCATRPTTTPTRTAGAAGTR